MDLEVSSKVSIYSWCKIILWEIHTTQNCGIEWNTGTL